MATPEQRASGSGIEAAGCPAAPEQPGGVENYHVQNANGERSRCEGTSRPQRREGFRHSEGARHEAFTMEPEAPRSAKTVCAGRASL